MAAMTVFVAESEEEAELIASSQAQSFVRLRTGNPGRLPPPVLGYRDSLPPQARAILDHIGEASAIGTPEQAKAKIEAFVARTGADEIMMSGATYDPAARVRSLELLGALMR